MNVRSGWSLLVLVFTLALGLAPEARAHSGSVIDGVLTQLVGDPYRGPDRNLGGEARRFYEIAADDGHRIQLDLSSAQLPPGGLAAVLNRRVRVSADVAMAAEAMGISDRFRVRQVQVLDSRSLLSRAEAATGNQKYISLLCKFADLPAVEPRAVSYFNDQLNAVNPGFNHYFREASYDTLTLDGSTADVAWVTLPRTRAQYGASTDPNVYLLQMFDDCTAAATGTVDFSQYFGINMMFNDKVDPCCAWGGGRFATLDGVTKAWPVTWMPWWGEGVLFGWRDHSVLAHEMSHAFGSAHSKSPSGDQYGSFWDVVSNAGGTCLVINPTYGCVGQHPVAYNKIAMGIMPAARIANHAAGAASTAYNIERMAQPQNVGGTFQTVKAAIAGTSAQFYTIESRQRVGYDANIPGDGVILHRVNTTAGVVEPAHLLSPLGIGVGLGDIDALWAAGSTFISIPDDIKITVNSFDAVTGTANVTVQPATDPGVYTFALAGYTVIEGGPAVNVVVTRAPPFTTAGSVVWTTSDGSAVSGTDFGTAGNPAPKSGTLNWTAGTGGTKNITVGVGFIPVINDLTQDPSRNFTIALSSPTGGILGALTSTTVTIEDSDSSLAFTGTAVPVAETAGNVVLTVARTGPTALAQAVTWTTANGTAMAGSDFGTLASTVQRTGTLIFPAGSGATQTITIPILNDSAIEGPETFTVTLTLPTSGAVLGTDKVATVTINSDENGVSMAAATRSLGEGSGAQEVLVNRAGSSGAVTVNFAVTNGSAVKDTHFSAALASGTLSWANGESGSKPIAVNILDDTSPNTARTFTVTLSAASGATLVAPMTTTVTIPDNENTVQFSAPTAAVTEGTANIVLTVTRMGFTPGQSADVTWTANNGTALAGTDFGILGTATAPTGTLSWLAGAAVSQTITIPILNDALVEGAKNFIVALSSPAGPNLGIGTNSQVTVTLNDNDKGVAFQSATYQVTEGTPSITLVVQRIGAATTAATATWATVNVGAESGKDFGVLNSFTPRTGTLSWLAGETANKNIVIPIINDTLGGEGDETFTVALTPGTGLVLGTPGIATVTIHDNDIPPESAAQFGAPKYLVVEGEPNVVLTVNRVLFPPGNSFALAASVGFSMLPGTALATSDYTASTGTLTWLAGNSDPKTITIPITNNITPESPESFRVLLANNSPGMGINTPEATVTILDDDEAFPADGVMPAGFSTAGGVNAGWHVSNDPGAFEGVYALKSDEIIGGETAGVEMAGTFAAGTVSFRVKVSTEANFDLLRFYIDGLLQPQSWSGTAAAGFTLSPSYPIPAGVHTLTWVYSKDTSVSMGLDAVYIDGLITPAFTP